MKPLRERDEEREPEITWRLWLCQAGGLDAIRLDFSADGQGLAWIALAPADAARL